MKEFEQKHDFKNPVNPDRGVFSFRWLLGRPGQGPEGLQMAETFRRVEGMQRCHGFGERKYHVVILHSVTTKPWVPSGKSLHQGGSDLCLEHGVDKPPGAWA